MIATALVVSTFLAAGSQDPTPPPAALSPPPAPASPAAPPPGEAPGARGDAGKGGGGRPLRQEEYGGPEGGEDDEREPHVRLTAWGGSAFDSGGSGRSSTLFGGEVAYAFRSLDLGVAGYGFQDLVEAEREWTPVVLLRLTQRFRTRRDVEAAFSLGVGAGRPDDWQTWFQVALGVRVGFGPVFLAGEIAFEQLDLLHLAAGLGVAF